jgi:hypothetical protein
LFLKRGLRKAWFRWEPRFYSFLTPPGTGVGGVAARPFGQLAGLAIFFHQFDEPAFGPSPGLDRKLNKLWAFCLEGVDLRKHRLVRQFFCFVLSLLFFR